MFTSTHKASCCSIYTRFENKKTVLLFNWLLQSKQALASKMQHYTFVAKSRNLQDSDDRKETTQSSFFLTLRMTHNNFPSKKLSIEKYAIQKVFSLPEIIHDRQSLVNCLQGILAVFRLQVCIFAHLNQTRVCFHRV